MEKILLLIIAVSIAFVIKSWIYSAFIPLFFFYIIINLYPKLNNKKIDFQLSILIKEHSCILSFIILI